ncbi:MAG: hypothetical protein AAF456_10385 [Planctomycetota bacterium]
MSGVELHHRVRRISQLLIDRLAAFAGFVVLICCISNAAIAQNSVQSVITLRNSLQLEGETFKIDSVSTQIGQSFENARIQVVDDGMRRVFFNRKLILPVGGIEELETSFTEVEIWQNVWAGNSPGEGQLLSYGDFDEHGHRRFTVREPDGDIVHFIQGITRVTPNYAELETLLIPRGVPNADRNLKRWSMKVATTSIPSDVLRSVLHKTIINRDDPLEYLDVVQFMLEAGLYRRAVEEQQWVLRRFPGIRDSQQQNLDMLRQALARDIVREVRMRYDVGQPIFAYQLAQAQLQVEQIAGQTLAELEAIQREIVQQGQTVDQVRGQLGDAVDAAIAGGAFDDAGVATLRRFYDEIEMELNVENVARFDTYIRLLGDDSITPEEKLALAISGWMAGANNALRNFATTSSMFPVRDIILEYLDTGPDDGIRRADLIQRLKEFEAGEPEYVAQIIEHMKPPSHSITEGYDWETPIEFFVNVPTPDGGTEQVQCLAHLPPEYNPYRRYPCILTLRPGINTEAQLNRFCGSFDANLGVRSGRATRQGYVVVSVDWKRPGQTQYDYSARAHTIVLRALRETLRSFSVDSDRVFLQGHSIGATAAYDVGISHPDHWAGVIGIGGNLSRYPDQYRANEHIGLPVYVVMGDADIGRVRMSAGALNRWLQTDNFLECMFVLYKGRGEVAYGFAGRGAEEFSEELPEIFEWMNAQRRIRPNPDSFDIECKVLRPWDNYFWFWELTGIPEENVTRPEHWQERGHDGLKISAKKRGNKFILGPANQGEGGILSLSPEFVDFTERIWVDGRGEFKERVDPSSAVILEDVRTRGDRQHPFWARLICEGKAWRVAEN